MRTTSLRTLLFVAGVVCTLGRATAWDLPTLPDACPGGSATSAVVIEVFSDFQCPACADFYQRNIRGVLTEYASTRKVCVLFQEFPLPQHEHARLASSYAVAAHLVSPSVQVRVIDALYSNQTQWSEDGQVENVLAKVLTDEELRRVSLRLRDPEVEKEIRDDLATGAERGVRSTPTVLVHHQGTTRRIPSTVQWEILRRYLDYLVSKPSGSER